MKFAIYLHIFLFVTKQRLPDSLLRNRIFTVYLSFRANSFLEFKADMINYEDKCPSSKVLSKLK